MRRRNFLHLSCFSCLGVVAGVSMLESCISGKYVNAILKDQYLQIQKSDFIEIRKDKKIERKFVLVKHDAHPFPICIYKISDTEYSAVYMECTHQGCELNAYDTQLVCPCHGSEFDPKGAVLQGPADDPLHQFGVKTDETTIYIQLRTL